VRRLRHVRKEECDALVAALSGLTKHTLFVSLVGAGPDAADDDVELQSGKDRLVTILRASTAIVDDAFPIQTVLDEVRASGQVSTSGIPEHFQALAWHLGRQVLAASLFSRRWDRERDDSSSLIVSGGGHTTRLLLNLGEPVVEDPTFTPSADAEPTASVDGSAPEGSDSLFEGFGSTRYDDVIPPIRWISQLALTGLTCEGRGLRTLSREQEGAVIARGGACGDSHRCAFCATVKTRETAYGGGCYRIVAFAVGEAIGENNKIKS